MLRRDIKGTFGRFFSVFAIIAIGTGFFSGIRITTPVMINTIDNFYRESRFFDYRMISTIGWTDEEVEIVGKEPGVSAVEGAWQIDMICQDKNGTEAVYKIHSITEEVDKIRIVEGRMPENSGECVIDNEGRMNLGLGDRIHFSPENDSDSLDSFSETEFIVVGFADSSLYINFERGTTSIGNGTVLGFMYLVNEAFAAEEYNEMYVKLDSDHVIYSARYEDQMDELRPRFEELTQLAADERYEKLYSDAEKELSDARSEFEDQRSRGEKELKDAEDELAEGKKKLEDAALELEDGKTELENAALELEDGRHELDSSASQLESARSQLDSAAMTLADSKNQLDLASSVLAESKEKIDSGEAELNNLKDQLDAANEELISGKDELDSSAKALEEYADALAQGKAEIDATGEQLSQMQEELNASQEELDRQKAEIDLAVAAGLIDEETADAAYMEIEAAQAELDEGRARLEAALDQLESAKTEYGVREAAYNSSIEAYEAGLEQYSVHLSEYEAGMTLYEDGKKKLEEAKKEYNDGTAAYLEGLSEYNLAFDRYQQGETEYYSGLNRYHEGLAEYERGLEEYKQGEIDYENAQAEYEDGLKEYSDSEAEYKDARAEFEQEIADAEQELADAEADLAAFLPPDTYLLERGTNIGYACFKSDAEIVKQIARILPVFFIIVAILVCMTTMTRMVDERRGQIGIMKGLGYSKGDIMFSFIAYSGTAAALGCISGYALGIFLFPTVIWHAYNMMYISVPFRYIFDWKLAVIVFAVSVAAAAGTSYFTCRNTITESAAELMRPRAPKAGKRVFLEYIPGLWSRMKFMHKVSARNILRYKKRFFMMIVGISGCTALLLTGFGLKDSIATFVKTQFDEIQTAQMGLVTKEIQSDGPAGELFFALEELDASYFMYNQSSWDLELENRTKSITLFTPSQWNDMDSFFKVRSMKGEELAYPDTGEALISVSIAQRYGVNVGDVISLRNEDMKTMQAVVSGVFENHVYNYVIVSKETLENALGDYSVNGIYVNVPEGKDIYEAQADLAQCENVISVSVFADLKDRIANMMSSLNYVVLLIIISAAALAFVVLYNLTNINIVERIREIATIKVLGFRKCETSEYVFRENIVLTTIGMAIGLGLGVLLHSFVIDQIVVDLVYFRKQITFISFILSIVLTYAFTLIVDRIMTIRLDKINMAESLKSVE